MSTRRLVYITCAILLSTLVTFPARADLLGQDKARWVSEDGTFLYLALGACLPLLTDGNQGMRHALRTLDCLAASTLLSEGLKRLTHERRPDGSSYTSFPSEHAATAFTVATAQSRFHPRQAPFWYLGAALIAESRVELNKHYVHDVVAGAALGYYTAHWELSRPRGLVLSPFIRPDSDAFGLQIKKSF